MTSLTMATTLSYNSNSSSFPHLYAPPPSEDTSMQHVPNVFVIPPEEEQDETPPWCYFDATEAPGSGLATHPDIDALEAALGFYQQTDNQAPAFHRSLNESQETIIMPRKLSGEPVSVPSNIDIHEGGRRGRSRPMGDDIVEVIKMRRNEGMSDIADARAPGIKKSATFRARASKALKSIKSVGKASRKPTMDESGSGQTIVHDGGSEAGTLPRTTTPHLKRQKSLMLSQLFTFSHSSRPLPSDTDVPMSPSSIMSSHTSETSYSLVTTPSEISLPFSDPHSVSSTLRDQTNTVSAAGETHNPLSSKKSFRRRLSVLDLQRLFTPSSPRPGSPDTNAVPSLSHSHGSHDSLPSPQLVPQTPDSVDDIFSSPQNPFPALSMDASYTRNTSSRFSDVLMHSQHSKHGEDDDSSFEMRLDSLHFDSLHIDLDEF